MPSPRVAEMRKRVWEMARLALRARDKEAAERIIEEFTQGEVLQERGPGEAQGSSPRLLGRVFVVSITGAARKGAPQAGEDCQGEDEADNS
jgi:hypothetical protein